METKFEIFKELFEVSQNEKRGLIVYLQGQKIAGIIIKITGAKAIEMRSREFSRIVVGIEAIEAVAIS